MAEEKKQNNLTQMRRMDDLGRVAIPKDFQEELDIKATELPYFSISIDKTVKAIILQPVNPAAK